MSSARLFVAPLLQWHRPERGEYRPCIYVEGDRAGRIRSVKDHPPFRRRFPLSTPMG